jgi:hypothetical protein
MREERTWNVVSLFSPSPFIYRPMGGERRPSTAMGATNEVVTRGAEEWGPSWCIFHEKSRRNPREYSGKHLAPPLVCHYNPTHGRVAREAAKWGRPTCGVGWSLGSSFRAVFRLGDCQVGLTVGMGVLAVFLASYLVVVGPRIRVLTPDWLRVCFFGSMMCHVHMDSCVAACRHVAWCGSYRAHMISCAYLFHPNSKVGK